MAAAASAAVSLDKAPIADVFKNLDVNTQKGLTSAEAQARAAKYGPNAIEEKKKSPWAMFLAYFWGADALDDRSRGDHVAPSEGLCRFHHHSYTAAVQRRARVLAGASGCKCAGRAEERSGGASPSVARWQVAAHRGEDAGPGRCRAHSSGRRGAGGPEAVRGRLRGCRPIGADGRIAASGEEGWGRSVFRIDHQEGRDERSGDRDRLEYVLWAHGQPGADCWREVALREGERDYRRCADRAGPGAGGGVGYGAAVARCEHPEAGGVYLAAAGGFDSGSDAGGTVDDLSLIHISEPTRRTP